VGLGTLRLEDLVAGRTGIAEADERQRADVTSEAKQFPSRRRDLWPFDSLGAIGYSNGGRAAMSLAAMAVGSLYLEVPPRIAGTTRALAAGSRMALPTWKRCKPRSRPRRSSLAPISAQFRSPAMPENHKLGDWRDRGTWQAESQSIERGARSEGPKAKRPAKVSCRRAARKLSGSGQQ
jgi:hypothetical protein